MLKTIYFTLLGAIAVFCFWMLVNMAFAGTVGDPYTGTPIAINGTPGATTIWEAENYDKGGEGIAYHDPHSCSAPPAGTTCTCPPGAYRPDGVNVCTTGAVTYISYDDAGLWVAYAIWVNATAAYTVELLAAQALPAISLTVNGGSNLPLNGTSTKVTVGFDAGDAPTQVQLSRDGGVPFAAWPTDTFFTLAPDGKSLTGTWCISSGCWGGVSGAHALTVVATYAGGFTSTVTIPLKVADGQITTPPASASAMPAYHVELDGVRYPTDPAQNYPVPYTGGWQTYAWGAKSDLIPMVPGVHRLRIAVDHGWFNWDSLRVKYAQDATVIWNGFNWVPIFRAYP